MHDVHHDEVLRVVQGYELAGLSDLEVAVMDFAAKVSSDSISMTDADSQKLRDLGLSDREIVDVALAAAMRNYFSRALHALAVDVDIPTDLPEDLRVAISGS